MADNKVSVITLGCPKNVVDSNNLIDHLYREGLLHTEDLDKADLILVNTCGFIEDAKRESIEEILRLIELKKDGKKLIVFGCLAERYKKQLTREIPEIDALFGVGEDENIIQYCKEMLSNGSKDVLLREGQGKILNMEAIKPSEYRETSKMSYAYLKIAEGCNRGCTFCVIPSIRGPYRSFSPDAILRRAEDYISSGVKELILVAQDISSYGKEFNGYDLSSLIRDITSIDNDFWVRLLYLYPTSINDKLLETIAEDKKVCKYLDIPLQHSEDRLLRAMGRSGGRDFYKELIKRIRGTIPDITLRTTMIVGFPGEMDEDFEGLRRFVEEMEFDRLGVFTYSKEEGTKASRLKGQIPKKIKDKRRHELMSIQSHISLEKNLKMVGNICRAIVDEVNNDITIARLSSQAPEIDGVVLIDGPSGVRGEFVHIMITEAFDYDLRGEVIS